MKKVCFDRFVINPDPAYTYLTVLLCKYVNYQYNWKNCTNSKSFCSI